MFGYIHANRQEMSEPDQKTYKSYYCGLCQALKRMAGMKGQVLLNYDVTFLCILLSSLYETENRVETFSCKVHPLSRKCGFISPVIDYGAAMNILLGYHNLMDDYLDNGNRKKKALADSLQKTYEKIRQEYPRQARAIEAFMDKTRKAEERHEENVDILSGYTGEMLAQIFLMKEDEWKEELMNIGFYLGKFIYMMDAYEDREDDDRHARFNPLILKYRECSQCYEAFMEQSLTSLVEEAAKSFERLPILENASILRNVLYSGVWDRYEYLKIKSGRKKNEQAGKER
ncbi:MAG: hypothetical protein IIU28_05465 [Lachnospiraceae bacterium]|nr:hypothetical protein [Lachnospiraceae bacterium]